MRPVTTSIVPDLAGLWNSGRQAPRTWILLRDSANILLESASRGAVRAEIRRTIGETDGVAGVHDFHVWVSDADQSSVLVHVVLAVAADGERVRKAVETQLRDGFKLVHVTIQTEREPCGDAAFVHT